MKLSGCPCHTGCAPRMSSHGPRGFGVRLCCCFQMYPLKQARQPFKWMVPALESVEREVLSGLRQCAAAVGRCRQALHQAVRGMAAGAGGDGAQQVELQQVSSPAPPGTAEPMRVLHPSPQECPELSIACR